VIGRGISAALQAQALQVAEDERKLWARVKALDDKMKNWEGNFADEALFFEDIEVEEARAYTRYLSSFFPNVCHPVQSVRALLVSK
jgi:hypothetical protein